MPNLMSLALLVSESLVTQKGIDSRTWLYRLGCWCWSRIHILYGVCQAFFCLLLTFAKT